MADSKLQQSELHHLSMIHDEQDQLVSGRVLLKSKYIFDDDGKEWSCKLLTVVEINDFS